MSVAIAALSLVDLIWGQAQSVDLFEPRCGARVAAGWGLLLAGVAIRLWAAGNLRKNAEVTMTGIYWMVRHPPCPHSIQEAATCCPGAPGAKKHDVGRAHVVSTQACRHDTGPGAIL